jgi:hypothetical protein
MIAHLAPWFVSDWIECGPIARSNEPEKIRLRPA